MTLGTRPSFLNTPKRPAKPRNSGLTHVLDKGHTLSETQDLLSYVGTLIDVWKFGWGTSYLDPAVESKVAVLHEANIKACTGGTLLELAWHQGCTAELFKFAAEVGFDCLEVSNGATDMPLCDKRKLISQARKHGFEVMAEVGSKDANNTMTPADWIDEIEGDMAAGANWIVAEGRESGTVGLYDESGAVRQSLLEVLMQSDHASKIIYETPRGSQQDHLLRELGHGVNLGNIATNEVMSLEALRLGLRADTLGSMVCEEVSHQIVSGADWYARLRV